MVMLAVAVSLVAAVASANAQGREVRAVVPFEYIVGSQTLSAGHSRIAASSDSGQALIIRDEKSSAARLANRLNSESTQCKLVFHQYGNRYFLVEVWTGDGGFALPKSNQEKAIEREMAMTSSRKDRQRDTQQLKSVRRFAESEL